MKANIDDYDHIHENMADVEDFISDPLDQESKDQQDEECRDCCHSVQLRCLQ
jgi:hypothetical protein